MSGDNGTHRHPALTERLAQLEAERERGQRIIAEREAELMDMRASLLRIEGAIAVLRELMTDGNDQSVPEVREQQPDQVRE